MVNIIIGDNSIGKTKYLLDLAGDHYRECVSSLNINLDNDIIPISKKKYEELKSIIGTTQTGLNGNKISFINHDLDGQIVFCSDELRNIFSLLCKDIKLIFLDEPEINLPLDELLTLLYVLETRDNQEDDIWITTHSSYLTGNYKFKYFTIDDDEKLVEIKVEVSDKYTN